MSRAWYNEIDPYAAQWLRNLIAAGHIAPGDVDERSIVDVSPDDLAGYTQCHFFAGIGGWSYALRLAGWPDDRPVWTGSCPCQPFSAAGAGAAADDRRHLWPSWLPLIAERRPAIVFGEQVEAAIGWGWLDLVFADLENEGYACGATVLPACGVGAPHIRNRVWFVADAGGWSFRRRDEYREHPGTTVTLSGEAPQQRLGSQPTYREPRQAGESAGPVVDAASEQVGFPGRAREPGSTNRIVEHGDSARSPTRCSAQAAPDRHGSSLVAAGWDAIDWLPCADGKARPVEPGPQQMADGFSEMLGRLRSDTFDQIEKGLSNAEIGQTHAREALQDLWCHLATQSLQRAPGRFRSIHEAPVLLAFMRELARKGWRFLDHLPSACWQSPEVGLREMRGHQREVARSPYGREPSQQLAGQPSDALSVLSQILAHEAQRAGMIPSPLAHGIPGRVGRLRAYGNAIVPQVAAEFVGSVMDELGIVPVNTACALVSERRRTACIEPWMANEIWHALVAECGCRAAAGLDDDHYSFVSYLSGDAGGFGHEFRFMGTLGFGGKFYNDGYRWRVGCYPEEKTPERGEMIAKANIRLTALHALYTDVTDAR